MSETQRQPGLHGIVAAFASPEALCAAAARAREAGFHGLDALVPYPIEGLSEALGHRERSVASWAFGGGLLGGILAWGMQHYSAVAGYPLNVGSRPLFSWPAFVPVTFELTVLGSALAAAFSVFFLSGLPELHHPLFAVPGVERATGDLFCLLVRPDDSGRLPPSTVEWLERQGALWVREVPDEA